VGQQQLLLLVLGVIIVGIAIILGIFLFQQNAVENKRDAVINEGLSIAANAQTYYAKPSLLGGGNKSFVGWEIPSQMLNSPNGSFSAIIISDQVKIIGTGNEIVSGSDSVKIEFIVTPTSVQTNVLK